ncbi:hypothetical protein BGZ54_009199 [Gamsiella multidivaricata]|nr:hypothetical protein BGZ54_009199 [Gamsiella multidivaricata]
MESKRTYVNDAAKESSSSEGVKPTDPEESTALTSIDCTNENTKEHGSMDVDNNQALDRDGLVAVGANKEYPQQAALHASSEVSSIKGRLDEAILKKAGSEDITKRSAISMATTL